MALGTAVEGDSKAGFWVWHRFFSPRRNEGHEGVVGRTMRRCGLWDNNGFASLDWIVCVGSHFFVRIVASW